MSDKLAPGRCRGRGMLVILLSSNNAVYFMNLGLKK